MTDDDLKRIADLLAETEARLEDKLLESEARLEAKLTLALRPIKHELTVLSALTRGNRDSLERINARLETVEALIDAPPYDTPRH